MPTRSTKSPKPSPVRRRSKSPSPVKVPRSAPTPRASKRTATTRRAASAARGARRDSESEEEAASLPAAVAAAAEAAAAAPTPPAVPPAATPRVPAARAQLLRPAVCFGLLAFVGLACVTAQVTQLPGRRVEPAALRAARQREARHEGGRVAAAPREEEPVTLREAAVPALLLAAAPVLTHVAARLRAPKPLQWLVGLAFVASASALAIFRPLAPAAAAFPSAAPTLDAVACRGAVHALLGEPKHASAAAALRRWVAQWEGAAARSQSERGEAGAASALLVFCDEPGALAEQLLSGISASGVVDAADVLRVSPLTECRRGEPSCDIDHFLAARTAAGRPALVLVEQLTSVGSDEAFDRAIAPLERP